LRHNEMCDVEQLLRDKRFRLFRLNKKPEKVISFHRNSTHWKVVLFSVKSLHLIQNETTTTWPASTSMLPSANSSGVATYGTIAPFFFEKTPPSRCDNTVSKRRRDRCASPSERPVRRRTAARTTRRPPTTTAPVRESGETGKKHGGTRGSEGHQNFMLFFYVWRSDMIQNSRWLFF
jgi:hypothetical protein